MKLEKLVTAANLVARRGKRLDKLAALVELLGHLEPTDVPLAVSFLAGELPEGRIGIGYASLRDAKPDQPAPSATLSLTRVGEFLRRIASTSGAGSKSRKTDLLRELLGEATEEEQGFLLRLLIGEVRQGALEGIMLDALARATDIPLPAVRRAAMLSGDLKRVGMAALLEGPEGIAQFRIQLFRPVQPMLAQPSEDLTGALERVLAEADAGGEEDPASHWDRMLLEVKIDGARVQVHKREDEVRVYSRRLNDVTRSVPEIEELTRGLPAREIILDGETFTTHDDGSPQPFQVTMRRFGRKLDVESQRREHPLEVRFFDCLYLDGDELIDLPLRERWRRISSVIPPERQIPRQVASSESSAQRFLEQSLAQGHEGTMAKALGSTYAAGSRGHSWLKIKPSHTLDLVVLAVEWGSGRRRGKLSNLHLGARDPADGSFIMLGKTFKGLTDKMLAWQTDKLLELKVDEEGHTVRVRPELVVEIAFNNVQASPQYPAGMALRFARVKAYRTDKSASQANTIDDVRALFDAEHPT